MADIFFSYARADTGRVHQLADALGDNGWTVWWDRSIPPGSSFDEVIEAQLMDARCVLVLWSKASISSSWVKEEAEEGLQRGVLTPVLIDSVRPPLGFRRVQAADLTDWDGDPSHDGYQQLLQAVHALLDDARRDDDTGLRPSPPMTPDDNDRLLPDKDVAIAVQVDPVASTPAETAAAPTAHPAASGEVAQRRFPVWLGPAVAVLVTGSMYLTLNYLLENNAAAIDDSITLLPRQAAITFDPAVVQEPPPGSESGSFFRGALAAEVAAGLMRLNFVDGRVVIVLAGDGVFSSGSDAINETYRSVLAHIGRVLAHWQQGPIEVSGHTDNIPIRTLRFPSNWHLSTARAEAVADLLGEQLGPAIDIVAQGRGESAPLARNDSRTNRALNRRVEIAVPLQ